MPPNAIPIQLSLDFYIMPPAQVFNCEYFEDLKRKWHSGRIDKGVIRAAFANLPNGHKILAWLDRPVRPMTNHTDERKFDE